MTMVVRGWILISAWLVGAGWILSGLQALNRAGYLAACFLGILATAAGLGRISWPSPAVLQRGVRKGFNRFKRPLPLLFLVLALLSLTAGSLYLPGNPDSYAYRIPRVFHWLGREQWHWIHAFDTRMNIAACGFEWLMAPVILFTGTDRCSFLINWFSYLLMPGLIFSVFIRLGIRRRVAWWWMWLLPSGWCYVWQAQTDSNDSFAAVYALAAVDLALRARQGHRLSDWWLALLAIALLSGAKQTNLPLALVLLVALYPGGRQMWSRPGRTLLVAAAAMLVSAVPVSVFNFLHTGNWMGMTGTPNDWSNTALNSPFWGIVGNAFCLTVQNLKPPVFPLDHQWNAAMVHFLQTPFGAHFRSFESFGQLKPAATETSSGIGLGISLLALVSVWRAGWPKLFQPAGLICWLRLSPWLSLLVFMAKVGSYENARQLAPYYFLLFPALLAAPGHASVVRRRWWRWLAALVMMLSALMVITARNRPLFPAQTLFGWLHGELPQSRTVSYFYAAYDCGNPVVVCAPCFQSSLPPDEKVIGYYCMAVSLAEPGFWRPMGTRLVERLQPGDPPAFPRARGIRYVVVDDAVFRQTPQTLAGWLHEYDGELVATGDYCSRRGSSSCHLYLVRLRPAPSR